MTALLIICGLVYAGGLGFAVILCRAAARGDLMFKRARRGPSN